VQMNMSDMFLRWAT